MVPEVLDTEWPQGPDRDALRDEGENPDFPEHPGPPGVAGANQPRLIGPVANRETAQSSSIGTHTVAGQPVVTPPETKGDL